MQIQSTYSASFAGMAPSSTLFGSSNSLTRAIFRRISWLSDPTSWFSRRVETQIQTQRRSAGRQSTIMWEDYGVTISYVGGRLVLSLYRHNSCGSVVGYVVEETIGEDTPDFRFADRGWRARR